MRSLRTWLARTYSHYSSWSSVVCTLYGFFLGHAEQDCLLLSFLLFSLSLLSLPSLPPSLPPFSPSLLSLPSLPPFPPSLLSPPSLPPARPVANISGPGDIIITAGMTLQLQCQATGAPPPNITWSRDGMTFDPSSERVVMTGRSLEIMNVNEDDSGTYFCIAVSTAGRVAVSARYIHTSILE